MIKFGLMKMSLKVHVTDMTFQIEQHINKFRLGINNNNNDYQNQPIKFPSINSLVCLRSFRNDLDP